MDSLIAKGFIFEVSNSVTEAERSREDGRHAVARAPLSRYVIQFGAKSERFARLRLDQLRSALPLGLGAGRIA